MVTAAVLYATGLVAAGRTRYFLRAKVPNEESMFRVKCRQRSGVQQCPKHNVLLVAGRPDVDMTRIEHMDVNGKPKYQCATLRAPWSGYGCPGLQRDKAFYVCPNEKCHFAVCGKCANLSVADKMKANVLGTVKALGIGTVVSFLALFLCQTLYFPAVQTCFMILSCHRYFYCELGGCFERLNSMRGTQLRASFIFVYAVALAFLIFVGIGFLAFLWSIAWRRKAYIVREGKVCGHFLGYKSDTLNLLTTRKQCRKIRWMDILLIDVKHSRWRRVLEQDGSVLRSLYDAYEFRYLMVLPCMLFFKVLLALPILFTAVGSLDQIIGASVVEVVQLFFLSFTNAFTNPWLDTLGKAGSVHHIYQLAMMAFHRVAISSATGGTANSGGGLSWAMVAGSAVYGTMIVAIVVHVAVIPAIRAVIEARRQKIRDAEERKKMEEQHDALAEDNVGSGVFEVEDDGQHRPKPPTPPPPEPAAAPPDDPFDFNFDFPAAATDQADVDLDKLLRELEELTASLGAPDAAAAADVPPTGADESPGKRSQPRSASKGTSSSSCSDSSSTDSDACEADVETPTDKGTSGAPCSNRLSVNNTRSGSQTEEVAAVVTRDP